MEPLRRRTGSVPQGGRRAADTFRRAAEAVSSRPISRSAPGTPLRNSASASPRASPVSRVRYPPTSRYPPARPRSAYTGTPASDSACASRVMVRSDTSSSRASSAAVIDGLDWSSSTILIRRAARIRS